VDDSLKRLLDAEARAREIIDAATRDRQRMLDEALAAANEAQVRFEQGRTELRAPFLTEARSRAEQSVAELSRKYEERQKGLRDMASRHEQEAARAALEFVLNPEN
jgi:V/A-type H+/Na+-transporting ATPase subunit G/H